MDERMRFVIRLKEGESMAALCREFGIARKIRERLLRRLPHEVKVPAGSTIHALLDRHGLITHPQRPRTRCEGTPLSPA